MAVKHFLLSLLLLLLPSLLMAQTPTLTINASNIGTGVSLEEVDFTSACLVGLGIAPTVYVRAAGNLTDASTGNSISLSKNLLQITAIGGTSILSVNLGGGSYYERALTTSDQTLLTSLVSLSVLSSGSVTMRYRIPQSEMTNYNWIAGTYTTNLIFTGPGPNSLSLCTNLTPITYTIPYKVIVSPFISATAPADIAFNVNDFKYFRSNPVNTLTASTTTTVTTTVPYNIRVKASASTFGYTPSVSNPSAVVNTSVNLVSVKHTTTAGTNTVNLTNASQNLAGAGVALSATTSNKLTSTIEYSLGAAQLNPNFVYAGVYNTTLTYDYMDTRSTPVSLSTVNKQLAVTVAEMGEITISNTPSIELKFATAADYKNGVSQDIANHLRVSKTTKFDISVKANTTTLTNGANSIPVGVIKIGPGSTGQISDMSEVTLSTSYQKILSGGMPIIDRDISVKYSIPANQVNSLLAKPAGTYSVSLTYSVTPL